MPAKAVLPSPTITPFGSLFQEKGIKDEGKIILSKTRNLLLLLLVATFSMTLLESHFTEGYHSLTSSFSESKEEELINPYPRLPCTSQTPGTEMRKQIMPSLSQSHPFTGWDKQENSQLLPPVPISYVKENNKELGHDHKHNTSLHARKNGALDYESTPSFCTNRYFNQTSVTKGSIKRHTDNGIIRTQVLSILCHRDMSTLGNNHQSSNRTQSVNILRKSRTH